MLLDFFQNTYLFNIVTFTLTILGIGLSIWFAIKKYPKRLTLYYEGTRPLTTQFLSNLSSITLQSKTINLDQTKDYLITTLFLQNTGHKDFGMQDFQDGIKIKFPDEYKILDVQHIDYPKDIQSSFVLNNNEIDIIIKTFKKKEIIRYDFLGELSKSIPILKSIKFHCRGSEISKSGIEKVSDRRSKDPFEEVIMGFLLTMLLTIVICFSLGYIGRNPVYQVISYQNKKDIGAIKFYTKDSIAFYDLAKNETVGIKIDTTIRDQPMITEYKGRRIPITVFILIFSFPLAMLFLLITQIKKIQLRRKLEKVI